MYSLLSSSDPAVQTQLDTFLFKALEKRKQSKVYTSLTNISIAARSDTTIKIVIILFNVDVNTKALTLTSVKCSSNRNKE